MGEPAEMSVAERTTARYLARRIVEGVTEDGPAPLAILQRFADTTGVPEETLLVWLAQIVARET